MNRIRIVWICVISNEEIRNNLKYNKLSLLYLYNRIKGKTIFRDRAQWNTNAIKEFKKYNNIELHIISPHSHIDKSIYEFEISNIHYHIFKSEDDNFIAKLSRKIIHGSKSSYSRNAKLINNLINKINPDIIHLIGAENPEYSEAVLNSEYKKPLLVSLQTLLMDPNFYSNYHLGEKEYNYKLNVEKQIINKADYIGTRLKKNFKFIKELTDTNAIFLNIGLALSEDINLNKTSPIYDFVYFSKELEKAGDWALESFIIAHKSNPNITLHFVGGYSDNFKKQIDAKISEANIVNNVSFSGMLPTHEDVLKEVKKARFALLPLKIDYISGTIREAIACGLPVITTETLGTPTLNEKRESVLIAKHGDFHDIANQMLKLYNDVELSKMLLENAITTINERFNNKEAMDKWVIAYYAIIDHYYNNIMIPQELMLKD